MYHPSTHPLAENIALRHHLLLVNQGNSETIARQYKLAINMPRDEASLRLRRDHLRDRPGLQRIHQSLEQGQ